MITQEELKEKLVYNPLTGVFSRLRGKSKVGTPTHHGYISIEIKRKAYLAHRLAWLYVTGNFPKELTDHINQIKTDNRFCNLREANFRQNCFNVALRKNNKTGIKGVYFNKKKQKYVAQIRINGVKTYLGAFRFKEDAGKVYDIVSKITHGRFYCN